MYNHKTSQRAAVMKNLLLPAVGITPGICGEDWASAWIDNRLREGLVAVRGDPTKPHQILQAHFAALDAKSGCAPRTAEAGRVPH